MRELRRLMHKTAKRIMLGKGIPNNIDGHDGDFRLQLTDNGVKLYAKMSGKWYGFTPDATGEDALGGGAIYGTSAGTYAKPTKLLLPSDSGRTYFVNMSKANIYIKLPRCKVGMKFKFIVDTASDNSSKKLFIGTATSEEYIAGHILDNQGSGIAGFADASVNTREIELRGTVATICSGDWIELTSDGTNWYVQGSSQSVNGANSPVYMNSGYTI